QPPHNPSSSLCFQPVPTNSSGLPPRSYHLKINVDGALSFPVGGAAGLVVRDHSASVLFATAAAPHKRTCAHRAVLGTRPWRVSLGVEGIIKRGPRVRG
ncbi:hypothetical protein LINPERHAP1_LOCUS26300, partial [Linum perenne]